MIKLKSEQCEQFFYKSFFCEVMINRGGVNKTQVATVLRQLRIFENFLAVNFIKDMVASKRLHLKFSKLFRFDFNNVSRYALLRVADCPLSCLIILASL
ncbi:hypothetical protein DVQ23_19745 [Yersinia enterocolitica]